MTRSSLTTFDYHFNYFLYSPSFHEVFKTELCKLTSFRTWYFQSYYFQLPTMAFFSSSHWSINYLHVKDLYWSALFWLISLLGKQSQALPDSRGRGADPTSQRKEQERICSHVLTLPESSSWLEVFCIPVTIQHTMLTPSQDPRESGSRSGSHRLT